LRRSYLTGGVGEKMPILRELVLEDMDYLGFKLNKENIKSSTMKLLTLVPLI
jgi:acetate kinase